MGRVVGAAAVGTGLMVAALAAGGLPSCAAGGDSEANAGGGGSASSSSVGPGTGGGANVGGGGTGGSAACAKFTAEAKQQPAAMLIALDMSASMTTSSKWGTAQLAVVSAIDEDVFDTMSLGLVTFPSSFTDPPQCICDYVGIPDISQCKQALGGMGVSCGTSALPQVAIAPAGTDKSNAPSGVRHDVYEYLVAHQPLSNGDDGSPIYDALVSGYAALKLQQIDKRILVLITDGGFSCTSISGRNGYKDGYGCSDWEIPDTVNQLITDARNDPTAPINTFIVGLPGSNSDGTKQGAYDTPPYQMELALSTYAVSGSPDTVDPTCDKQLVYTQGGAAPAKPCHIDLANGTFDANALAAAVSSIRGKALGCVYDLPDPPQGETIDKTLVNVLVTIGGTTTQVPKRSDPADACAADGCWDYNANGQVELVGKTCADVTGATDAKVEIRVGCATVIK